MTKIIDSKHYLVILYKIRKTSKLSVIRQNSQNFITYKDKLLIYEDQNIYSFLSCFFCNNRISLPAVALLYNDVDYQYFRDFAENKGPFSVGSMNIDIKDNNGQLEARCFIIYNG
ncbi:hypothetical protein NDCJBJIB_03109 [Mannheimia haemolytica]